MLSLKQHLQGGALYDDVFSQYGPSWYACQMVIHALTDLPVTHDVTRFKTIVVWLLAACIAALVAMRLSRCGFTALTAFGLAFLHLDRLTLEPGHPQELCLLAVLAVAALAASDRVCHIRRALVLGLIVGTAVMTKLNVGLLLVASITLAYSLSCKSRRWRWVGTLASIMMIVGGIAVVTGSTFLEERGLRLPALVAFSMLSVTFFAYRSTALQLTTPRAHAAFHFAWGLTAAAFVAVAVSQGTTIAALLDGLVLQHVGFASRFYMAAPIFGFAGPLAVAGLGTAIWATRSEHRMVAVRYVRLCMLALLTGVMLRHFVDLKNPLEHGLDDRGHAGLIMSVVGPFAWLVLVRNPSERWSTGQRMGRLMLACIGGLQPLIAYPTPGTQMAVGSLPLLIITLLCIRDFVCHEVATKPASIGFARTLRVGLVVCSVGLVSVASYHANAFRTRLQPLGLRGAQRLRLPPAQVAELHALVRVIRQNGDTFVSLHNGYNSLYLLADIEPPTGMNATFWPWMLSTSQQDRVVRALRESDRVCCLEKVVNERKQAPATPLGRYLTEGFIQHATIGPWRVMSNGE